jgi:hypothetical protein
MKIAIFIPTLFRPHNIERVVQSIRDTTNFPYEIYLMCPKDDFETISVIENLECKYWTDEGDMRFVKRIQFMYENTDEEWFLTGSDDIVFQPDWLDDALECMNYASVISFEDECNPNLPGTNFLIEREYIEKYSGVIDVPNTIFHQGYYHNYCDNELVAVATRRGEFIKSSGVLRHYHPTVDRANWDGIYMIAQSYMADDAALFASRERLWLI